MIKQKTIDELIKKTQDLIKDRYEFGNHHTVVAAGVLTTSGNMYFGINLGTTQPSLATCAEMITIGMAHVAERDMQIAAIVAARDKTGYLVSPCGRCREYISDYGPNALVAIENESKKGYEMIPISELLPHKYYKKTCK